MEYESLEPKPAAILPAPTVRHDGWTGDRMAIFLENLAETAVVAEACEAAGMGISGAYAARRRNPAFAAAWEAALTIARDRLADTLLARSIEGNVEQIWRDGHLVGERHLIDNKLGLQILRRLDRLAESSRPTTARPEKGRDAVLRSQPIDWNSALHALRTGDDEGVAKALALIDSNEVEEVAGDPNHPLRDGEADIPDLSDRCWFSEVDGCWLTDFPPPAGFTGWESRDYDEIGDDEPYQRSCTPEEVEILEADAARERAADRAEDEALRDSWFALLRDEAAV